MSIARGFLVVLSALLAGGVLTWAARAYALRRSVLDIPNERSSHSQATPRGGGIGIVIPVLVAVLVLWMRGQVDDGFASALVVGGGTVALLGWIDDHRPLGVGVRAVGHLLAAAWAVASVGGGLPWWWYGVFVIGVAWFLNLYNFLDGTDGYAGTQAICAGLAGCILYAHAGMPGPAQLCLVIAGASGGFLLWNWPPARIFMGDVGSCFLGFVFGVLAVYGHARGIAPAWEWTVLLGVFFWDATLTLLRRVCAGERWREAHKTHAYQRLHQMGWTHRRLAITLVLLNVFLLWPVVWIGRLWDNFAIFPTVFAASVLGALWWAAHHQFRCRSKSPS